MDALCAALGMVKVGWIFAHPLREDKFNFSGQEVIEAAEQMLEAAQGVEDTPLCYSQSDCGFGYEPAFC